MPSLIHPQAIVAPGAELGSNVRVGPFAIVGEHVRLGDGVVLHPHAIVDGHTTLGPGCEVFPGACVGLRPQDLKYDGSPTTLEVGARTIIRECATLHVGSTGGRAEGVTRVGDDCLLMAYCHVAHDCVIKNHVIIANSVQIAGHVTVEDHAILGGVTNIHQFCRVGTRAITGGASHVIQDVPPFMLADGHPARLRGLNVIGLRRAGFSEDTRKTLKRAYKTIFASGAYTAGVAEVRATLDSGPEELRTLIEFLDGTERGVMRAARGN